MEVDIVALAEPQSQTDPKFQTLFKYTRITAKGMRIALIIEIRCRSGFVTPIETFEGFYSF
jgi:hypothetical protein